MWGSLAWLKSLRHLNLQNNCISGLSWGALGTTQLQTLDLTSNVVSQLEPKALPSLASLTSLSLAKNRLSQLDGPSLTALTALTHLDLKLNKLYDLPHQLLQLPRLRSLLLAGCPLTELPDPTAAAGSAAGSAVASATPAAAAARPSGAAAAAATVGPAATAAAGAARPALSPLETLDISSTLISSLPACLAGLQPSKGLKPSGYPPAGPSAAELAMRQEALYEERYGCAHCHGHHEYEESEYDDEDDEDDYYTEDDEYYSDGYY